MGRYAQPFGHFGHRALMLGDLLNRFELKFFRKSGRAHNDLLNEYYEAKKCLANPGRFSFQLRHALLNVAGLGVLAHFDEQIGPDVLIPSLRKGDFGKHAQAKLATLAVELRIAPDPRLATVRTDAQEEAIITIDQI